MEIRPSTVDEAAAVLKELAAAGTPVRPVGTGSRGTWGGADPAGTVHLSTAGLDDVLEHNPGDFTAVLRAGVPLAVAQEHFARAGQLLALDPAGFSGPEGIGPGLELTGGTIGGLVATADSGPLRHRFGGVRDLVIGVEVVLSDGTVARAGGKVIKNVAGYDLGKLFTGSYGTLGLITECAFRLHPRPPVAATVRRTAPAAEIGALLAAVRAEQVVPSAVEIDAPAEGPVTLAVLVEGTAAGVRERAARLEKVLVGQVSEDVPAWWGRYPWDRVGMKLTVPLSRVPELLGLGAAVRGSAGTGVLYADVPVADAPAVVERLRATAVRAGGHAVVLTAPRAVREVVDMWGPVAGLALMRRVKDRFDPGHRFAPGRFVGGI